MVYFKHYFDVKNIVKSSILLIHKLYWFLINIVKLGKLTRALPTLIIFLFTKFKSKILFKKKNKLLAM